MRPGFYKGLHRVLRLACGAAGVYLVLKSYAVLGKGENASHVNAFLQQLEYEAQTAAVRQVLPGLLYPAQAGKTSESLTEGIVREAFRPVSYTHLDVYKRQGHSPFHSTCPFAAAAVVFL